MSAAPSADAATPGASASASATAAAAVASALPATKYPTLSIGDLHRGGSQLLPMCKDLAAIHACAFCMLRYVNIKQEKAYRQTADWLQAYTSEKVGWSLQWSRSGCPLCLDILGASEAYWSSAIAPALQEADGTWKYEITEFALNISEPVLAKIRQHATNHVLKPRYSRLQNGAIDLKEALKWQMASLIAERTGGKFVQTQCDFGFLLTFATDVPDDEYGVIVSTLPRAEQLAARRAPGDFTIPVSNNPSMREYKNDGQGHFKKRGKKHPRQDAMGQKTVMEALPRIKPERWAKLDIFKPILNQPPTAAATPSPDAPASAATPDGAVAMDTSSSAPGVAPAVASNIHVPPNYPLPLTALVPFPTLLLTAHREPILLSGNYRKFYRFLSQSVWTLGPTKMIGAGAERNRADAKAQSLQGAAAAVLPEGSAQEEPQSDDDEEEEQELLGDDEDGDDDDVGGRRMTDSSVEEEIVRVLLDQFQAREYKFHSSGREDMDVRMLGNGRQFFLEFVEAKKVPKSVDFCSSMQALINANSDYVEVLNLHVSNKGEFNKMKRSVTTKRKTYRCVVWVEAQLEGPEDARLKKLDAIRELTLQQRTPIRVLHRRALLTRPKVIHSARTEYVNSHFFYLDLVTSSGTYVKEFVHGDRGRTMPNVCTITGTHAEILQLDVIGFDTNQLKL